MGKGKRGGRNTEVRAASGSAAGGQGTGEMQREEGRAGRRESALPADADAEPPPAGCGVVWCVETGGFGMRRRFYTGPDRAATVRAAPAAARPDFAVLAPVASAFWEARIVLN